MSKEQQPKPTDCRNCGKPHLLMDDDAGSHRWETMLCTKCYSSLPAKPAKTCLCVFQRPEVAIADNCPVHSKNEAKEYGDAEGAEEEFNEPTGSFIFAQTDLLQRKLLPDGEYYHYSDVCVMLKRYRAKYASRTPSPVKGAGVDYTEGHWSKQFYPVLINFKEGKINENGVISWLQNLVFKPIAELVPDGEEEAIRYALQKCIDYFNQSSKETVAQVYDRCIAARDGYERTPSQGDEGVGDFEVKRMKNGRGESHLLVIVDAAVPDIHIGSVFIVPFAEGFKDPIKVRLQIDEKGVPKTANNKFAIVTEYIYE